MDAKVFWDLPLPSGSGTTSKISKPFALKMAQAKALNILLVPSSRDCGEQGTLDVEVVWGL